jgi:type IV secretion system protein VirD4
METSSLPYLLSGGAAVALLRWRFKKRPGTFGSAGWLPAWTASGKRLFQESGGLLAGDWIPQLPVYYRGGGHALTVAPTGSGKGTCAIVPNLLRHPWIFLIDPGGENTAICARAWQRKGYTFYCLNPWGMHAEAPWALPSHAVNPLEILNPANGTFASDADLLADMIVTRTGREEGSSAFFKGEAKSAIRAFLMHIVTTEPKERRTLLTLRKYVTHESETWHALIEAMKASRVAGGLIAREAAQLERREEQAPEEFSAVLSTMKQDTNFIEDPVMQRALGASPEGVSADLSALKGVKDGVLLPGCVVSIVMPLEYLETHAAYARLIIGAALWRMEQGKLSRGRVLFLMDEFPALGRVNKIAGGLAVLRKYRVWLWPIIQNIGQLKSLYRENWQTFMSNAGMKQFIGAGDLETAQYVSQLCGETTVETSTRSHDGKITKSEAKRQLATVEEVMTMNANMQIVLIDNLKPALLRKTPYWQRPSLQGWFNANPYHPGTPALDPQTALWKVFGMGLRFCAWLVRPAPPVIAALAIGFTLWAEPGFNSSAVRDARSNELVCTYATPRASLEWRIWNPNSHTACPGFTMFRTTFE